MLHNHPMGTKTHRDVRARGIARRAPRLTYPGTFPVTVRKVVA